MAKNPFERILSVIDRKKIFQKLISGRQPIVCKFKDGSMGEFTPAILDSKMNVLGSMKLSARTDAQVRKFTGMFRLGKNLYFVNSRMLRLKKGWSLANTPDFYLLNRREAFRVDIRDDHDIYFEAYEASGQKVEIKTRVLEFSASGARLRWTHRPGLSKGDRIKGQLHWLREKKFPLELQVKHFGQGIVGVAFVGVDSLMINRLKLMSIEIQQITNFELT